MKKLILCLAANLIIQLNTYSQSFFGKVIYETSLWKQKKLNLDTLKAPESTKKIINDLLSNKNTLTYVLRFNKSKSSFKKSDQIETKKNTLLKVYVGTGTFYYDKENKVSLLGTASSSPFFIMYPPTEWRLTNETKKINGYLCGKAITTLIETSGLKKQTKTIIAWFAFDLPYSYGPNQFFGLPGLVLELDYVGKYRLRATKIILNNEAINIKIPKKNKRILKKDYEKKMEEMFAKRMLRKQN